jgi:hypothetical protein
MKLCICVLDLCGLRQEIVEPSSGHGTKLPYYIKSVKIFERLSVRRLLKVSSAWIQLSRSFLENNDKYKNKNNIKNENKNKKYKKNLKTFPQCKYSYIYIVEKFSIAYRVQLIYGNSYSSKRKKKNRHRTNPK